MGVIMKRLLFISMLIWMPFLSAMQETGPRFEITQDSVWLFNEAGSSMPLTQSLVDGIGDVVKECTVCFACGSRRLISSNSTAELAYFLNALNRKQYPGAKVIITLTEMPDSSSDSQ